MVPPWIIFDFDCTIANTFQAGLETINSFAESYGYRRVSPQDYLRLRDLPSRQILKEVGVSLWKLPAIAKKVRKAFAARIPSQETYPGVREVLEILRQRGVRLGIVTNNNEENVRQFLRRHGLESLFDFVASESSLFGKGQALKRILRRLGIASHDAWYVSDETKDVDAARQAGLRAAAVTWGVNSKTALAAQRPDRLLDKPEEILELAV